MMADIVASHSAWISFTFRKKVSAHYLLVAIECFATTISQDI
jgi:hypothetical protein